ncbi:DUF2637 domain-containing protein [Streptacidiphilus albus]|uniref:DUF2637 domain-containing protein n=1 Tax=Streptacidiphilus albus TaxID=105425 RepID=UPI001364A788|nr:DUF2637 domain-containing protein [Streptacidiphilus albus]
MGSGETAPPRLPDDASRRDAATANIVVAVLGLSAFAVSFTHVQRLAVRSGQIGWVADGIAASVELMALAAVTEMRRRRRQGEQVNWPRGVLVLGVVMSLAANLATAQPTVWGFIMAAWPQLAFLAVAGLIETRSSEPVRQPEPVPVRQPEPVPVRQPEAEPVRQPEAEPVRQPEAPELSPSIAQARTVRSSERRASDGPEPAGAETGARTQRRPSRAAIVATLHAEITADADWKPDYTELTARTGYSLSWCEKRVAEARLRIAQDARRQPYAEAIRTEPPVLQPPVSAELTTETSAAAPLASVTAMLPRRSALAPAAAPTSASQSDTRKRQRPPTRTEEEEHEYHHTGP